MIPPSSRPALAGKARLRFDRASGGYLLLYPERGLALNAVFLVANLHLARGQGAPDLSVESRAAIQRWRCHLPDGHCGLTQFQIDRSAVAAEAACEHFQ